MSIASAKAYVEKLSDPDSPEAQEWNAFVKRAREEFVADKDFTADELLEALLEFYEDGEQGIILSEPPGL